MQVHLCAMLCLVSMLLQVVTLQRLFRKGKEGLLKLCQNDQLACAAMVLLGCTFDKESLKEFRSQHVKSLCKLYGKQNLSSVDEYRYLMSRAKRSQSQSLPSSNDALIKHTLRANYPAAI